MMPFHLQLRQKCATTSARQARAARLLRRGGGILTREGGLDTMSGRMLKNLDNTSATPASDRARSGRGSRERGSVLIWTVICLFMFVGFVGLMCDWAYMLLVAHQLQNAA